MEALNRKSTAIWVFLAGLSCVVVALKIQQGRKPEPNRTPGPRRSFRQFVKTQTHPEPEPAPAGPETPEWAAGLDVRAARLIKDRLVQVLPNGVKVTFTLDPGLQAEATRLFRHYAPPYGSAVMLEVQTGRVLALAGISASEPKLDPLTLALRAWAPAASVFKVITTAALLSENRARPTTRICFHDATRMLNAHHLVDDPEKDRQCDTLAGGLAKSLNPVFGKLSRKHLDRATLLQYANAFGFNRPLPFIVPAATSPAAIPEEPLARARVASGFWHVNLSPLHGALIAQAIANRGQMTRPRLVEKATGAEGKPIDLPPGWKRKVTTEYVARVLSRMLVMTTTVGTAREGFYDRRGRAYIPWAQVAGKTGSLTRTEPYVDYNWFVGFAPARRPKVAFAILLGNAPRWRIKAFHMARFLLYTYLSRNINGTVPENRPGRTTRRTRQGRQP